MGDSTTQSLDMVATKHFYVQGLGTYGLKSSSNDMMCGTGKYTDHGKTGVGHAQMMEHNALGPLPAKPQSAWVSWLYPGGCPSSSSVGWEDNVHWYQADYSLRGLKGYGA